MDDLAKLEKQLRAIRSKINKIEIADKVKSNAKYVGKCFKCKNSYGGGSGWWLYAMVESMDSDGNLSAVQFEKTSDGRVEISRCDYFRIYNEHKEMPKEAMLKEWRKVIKYSESLIGE